MGHTLQSAQVTQQSQNLSSGLMRVGSRDGTQDTLVMGLYFLKRVHWPVA